VSIIQYLLNDPEPTRIVRQGMDFIQDGVEDVVFMNVAYPNKVVANIHVSWLDPTKVRKVTIVGSKKMIVYDDIADNKVAIYDKGIDKRAILGENMDFDQPNTLQFDYRSGDVLLPKVPGGEPLAREVDHFLDCIEKKTPCLTGPSHAEKVVRILEA